MTPVALDKQPSRFVLNGELKQAAGAHKRERAPPSSAAETAVVYSERAPRRSPPSRQSAGTPRRRCRPTSAARVRPYARPAARTGLRAGPRVPPGRTRAPAQPQRRSGRGDAHHTGRLGRGSQPRGRAAEGEGHRHVGVGQTSLGAEGVHVQLGSTVSVAPLCTRAIALKPGATVLGRSTCYPQALPSWWSSPGPILTGGGGAAGRTGTV